MIDTALIQVVPFVEYYFSITYGFKVPERLRCGGCRVVLQNRGVVSHPQCFFFILRVYLPKWLAAELVFGVRVFCTVNVCPRKIRGQIVSLGNVKVLVVVRELPCMLWRVF